MALLELSPDEIAFLAAPPVAPDSLQPRLTARLAAILTARLRLQVQATVQTAGALAEASATPNWQPDAALSTLWLTRRLGGQRVQGRASFVPPTLIHTLDALLAECWLETGRPAALPSAMAWRIATELTQAMLVVQLPPPTTDMTRWARGVIRHG
ncbi:MAG: hypothetical protein R6W97_10035 [Thiobacillus sp.]